MKYKKKKYFKQTLDLQKLAINSNFFWVFQLKAVNVSNWVLLKKTLSKHDLKLKIYSTKLLKKNYFFTVKSKFLKNVYASKVLIVYFKKKLLLNTNYLKLEKLLFLLYNNTFLVAIYVFFIKSFLPPKKFKYLLSLCLKDSKVEFIYLILHKHLFFLKLFNKKTANQISV